jgi:predicted DNA binding CopG/RHH family protein
MPRMAGHKAAIPLRLTKLQAKAIRALAKQQGVSQQEAIRRLLELGFNPV